VKPVRQHFSDPAEAYNQNPCPAQGYPGFLHSDLNSAFGCNGGISYGKLLPLKIVKDRQSQLSAKIYVFILKSAAANQTALWQ
jgi:hypothetical protein